MPQKILPFLIALALLGGAGCVTPSSGRVSVSSKPGWGRTYTPEEEKMTVRAVPAAARPALPVTRLGKPGWGRD